MKFIRSIFFIELSTFPISDWAQELKITTVQLLFDSTNIHLMVICQYKDGLTWLAASVTYLINFERRRKKYFKTIHFGKNSLFTHSSVHFDLPPRDLSLESELTFIYIMLDFPHNQLEEYDKSFPHALLIVDNEEELSYLGNSLQGKWKV